MRIQRPPIVTVLGHVDHGKTTLLDYIRQTSIASHEHGGITQAIGAYQVETKGKVITFIDTPGHAAFEKMRSRGAQVADLAVLVVAIDDGIMPQTVEAIKHIHQAKIPLAVAVTKVDLPGVDIKVQSEKIKKQLSDNEVLIEEYGGDVPYVLLSAKTGQGVEDLLEIIGLLGEVHDLTGDPEEEASGVIIESSLDKFKGPIATVLVRDGSLKKGDKLKAGVAIGKVKTMLTWSGQAIDLALPSMPVEVLGFDKVPAVGTKLNEATTAFEKVENNIKNDLLAKLRDNGINLLSVIIKADKQGSLEAIMAALESFNKDQQHLKIISSATGDISDSDIELAQATKAIVLGFNISISGTAKKMGERGHVLIRTYTIIYELIDELSEVIEEMLSPDRMEEVLGEALIGAEFPFGKNERIAGCRVLEGVISKGAKIRILREDNIIGETKIKSLKKSREEVAKIEKGQECGIIFDPIVSFEVGDIVESFRSL